jgi:hypothetical protein
MDSQMISQLFLFLFGFDDDDDGEFLLPADDDDGMIHLCVLLMTIYHRGLKARTMMNFFCVLLLLMMMMILYAILWIPVSLLLIFFIGCCW